MNATNAACDIFLKNANLRKIGWICSLACSIVYPNRASIHMCGGTQSRLATKEMATNPWLPLLCTIGMLLLTIVAKIILLA